MKRRVDNVRMWLIYMMYLVINWETISFRTNDVIKQIAAVYEAQYSSSGTESERVVQMRVKENVVFKWHHPNAVYYHSNYNTGT